jgi:predicted AAA+ superfamily ATPase
VAGGGAPARLTATRPIVRAAPSPKFSFPEGEIRLEFSFWEGEIVRVPDESRTVIRDRLRMKLADSLAGDIAAATPRRVRGPVAFPGKATAVIGMRRAGKTTLLHQVRRERLEAGVPRDRLPYLHFEDEQLAGIDARDLGDVLEEYYRTHATLRGSDTVTWCFDEIQVVPGWERFVRRILDSEKVDVLVSGSSAALLSREIATSMRGRAWEVVLHPFGFDEVLRHAGHAVPTDLRRLRTPDRSRLERAFLDYLVAGGFPEAQGLGPPDRHQLLSSYVDVAMLRDVVERHSVSNVTGLRWMVRHILSNPAGRFSAEKFHASLRSQGVAIARDTVHELLAHLVDCFLVRTVWIESDSERRRMVNPRKAYPVDPGLIPVYDRSGRANVGHALETVVLIELERRRLGVTYVRTASNREVDFLARRPGGRPELIQVCADARDPDVLDREVSALEEAAREHPDATRRILTATRDGLPRALPDGVVAQPAYEWILAGDA